MPTGPRLAAKRISDGSVLRLLKLWLRAPIQEEDEDGTRRMKPNRCGTPQGGVISPLLANLYLNHWTGPSTNASLANQLWSATRMELATEN